MNILPRATFDEENSHLNHRRDPSAATWEVVDDILQLNPHLERRQLTYNRPWKPHGLARSLHSNSNTHQWPGGPGGAGNFEGDVEADPSPPAPSAQWHSGV